MATKLHAVTERVPDRENDRFRDLIDLLLLRELQPDLGRVAEAVGRSSLRETSIRGRRG